MPTETLSQSDLAFNVDKPDWVALQILLEEIEQELTLRRNALLFSLSNWFLAVGIFRKFEEREMIGSEPSPRDRQHHRAFLSHLLAHGERLFLELHKHTDIDPKHIGVDIGEVQATVEELRLKLAEWFQEMTDERRSQILREAFGVEASAS